MAVSGEVLDALEAAFTEEKGVPLEQQVSFRYRVVKARPVPTRPTRQAIRRARSAAVRADGERPGRTLPDSAAPEAD
ncbi:hypothetical protein KDK95_06580 [Actinospica sp. MGRD01-02]|uniref:Uncharacterized protein n=1 Tax=Actinospica acidithermotolerans TaxID=2828514 RepID=A0A941E6E3_9ACTN|nr:hypothetical protein [Actinospica acidithermotolerans]MBR7825966.1 hypothetical protein [Actinospica acidithermotolerans]